jgi:hypothetical protein
MKKKLTLIPETILIFSMDMKTKIKVITDE